MPTTREDSHAVSRISFRGDRPALKTHPAPGGGRVPPDKLLGMAHSPVTVVRRVVPVAGRDRLQRRARLLAWGGIAWHFVEFAIAVGAG